jgi:hypothetical protein
MHRILHRLLARSPLVGSLQLCQPRKQLVDRSLPRVYVAHRRLNVIVSRDILQRKGIGILASLGQKGMTKRVQSGIGMSLDLLAYLAHLFFQHPRPKRLCRVLGVREDIVALGVFQKPLQYFLHFMINYNLAPSRSPFQTALDY